MNAIGLRRDPQPPMPMVIPLCTDDTASSRVVLLSDITSPLALLVPAASRLSLLGTRERVPVFVGDAGQVEFEREALFHAVPRGDRLDVDEVQRLLGGA